MTYMVICCHPKTIISMNITLNNRPESIPGKEKITVSELLEIKNFTFKFLVVRINGKTVKPGAYQDHFISDGDQVQVLHLISGG